MIRTLAIGGLLSALGAGCIAPNLDPFEAPTDRELAAMVNRHAAFGESPYGPDGAPTPEELAATGVREALARGDREAAVWWMAVDDPAWGGRPDALVPGQAQWLTALEARVIATQRWERGAVIVKHLEMDWMRDQERRAIRLGDIQEHARANRSPYGGYVVDHVAAPDSDEAEDGFPGLTPHERHVWRIHWGYGQHWWMADERRPMLRNVMVVPTPVLDPPARAPDKPIAKPADTPAPAAAPADTPATTPADTPAKKQHTGEFF